MLKSLIIFLILVTSSFADEKVKVVGKVYFTEFMGHVHSSPSDLSSSNTIVQCAQALNLLDDKEPKAQWSLVSVGEDKGYVRNTFFSEKRPTCFQENYPKFYQSQNFDMTQLYFWGRLNDHFISGESRSM